MDLNSYADLAVRLVNSTDQGRDRGDGLATVENYRALVADRPHLAGKVTAADLEALRLLREELRLIFASADCGQAAQVAQRLNALLVRHPIHQELASHDGQPWHIHLVESGSAADRHAAGAIAGIFFGRLYMRTGRLGEAVVAHGTANLLIVALLLLTRVQSAQP